MTAKLELTQELAEVMLMTDLMASRLAAFYQMEAGKSEATLSHADELIFALERKAAEMLRTLDAAQTAVLDSTD
jgi:hypothetical protein